MKIPNLITALVGLALASTSLMAGSFSDTFTRANTTSPNGGLGTDWTIGGTGNIFLSSNQTATQSTGISFATYNPSAAVLDNSSFSLSASMLYQANEKYAGLLFNYNTGTNTGLVARMKFDASGAGTFQFIKYSNGTESLIGSSLTIPSVTFAINTNYVMSVVSTGTTFQYGFTIETGGGAPLYSTTLNDTTSTATGGQAGFYFATSFLKADNFSLTTTAIPEPANAAMSFGLISIGALVLRRRRA